MKFIAILKDSLRESIDAKVFYVMAGLSLLLIALGATVTFAPRPGGEMVMNLAAAPLSIDLANLDPAEMQRGHGDPVRMMRRLRGSWQVEKVTPLGDAEDLPTSTFRVVVKQAASIPFFMTRPKPEKAIEQIRERFGLWDDQRIAEVLDVKHDNGSYLIDARLTEAGRRWWPYDFSLFFGALPILREGAPLGMQLYVIETVLVNGIGAWVAILVSIVITAFFIPNMLRKGSVDMLIVKPMRRSTLLLYKYVGGLLFIFLNTALAVGGVWLALSLRSGIWAPGFLVSIAVITFFFAILYAVSTLFGVMTRSPIVAILMTCGAWFVLFIVGTVNVILEAVEKEHESRARPVLRRRATEAVGLASGPGFTGPLMVAAALADASRPEQVSAAWRISRKIVSAVHYVLPRTGDLDALMTRMLQRDLLVLPRGLQEQAGVQRDISWGESLTVSGAFIALMLGVSCWWFATKDY